MRHGVALLLALATAGACDLTVARTRFQFPAQIRAAVTDSVNFITPDTVNLSTNFDISVTSFGGGCVTKGPTNIFNPGTGTVELRPFDITETGGDACTRELRTFTHSVTLQLVTPGANSVIVVGRDADGSNMSRTRSVFAR